MFYVPDVDNYVRGLRLIALEIPRSREVMVGRVIISGVLGLYQTVKTANDMISMAPSYPEELITHSVHIAPRRNVLEGRGEFETLLPSRK